jgi:hypothetical protein
MLEITERRNYGVDPLQPPELLQTVYVLKTNLVYKNWFTFGSVSSKGKCLAKRIVYRRIFIEV